MTTKTTFVQAAQLSNLRSKGSLSVQVDGHPVVLFLYGDQVYAVDNRCPHMGFPLNRGTVRDGLLTCHWHHARFDLEGGGTLDPFADDVRTFPVRLEDDQVYIVLEDRTSTHSPGRWLGRLEEGLEHNLEFVM